MAESPEGRIERLPRPRFGRGADVKKTGGLLEGKLRRRMAESAISLLFAQALGQEKERGCAAESHGVCWLRFPVAAGFQKLRVKGMAT